MEEHEPKEKTEPQDPTSDNDETTRSSYAGEAENVSNNEADISNGDQYQTVNNDININAKEVHLNGFDHSGSSRYVNEKEKQAEELRKSVYPIEDFEIQNVRRVFVPSATFSEVQIKANNPILLIVGKPQMGKYFAAKRVGQLMKAEGFAGNILSCSDLVNADISLLTEIYPDKNLFILDSAMSGLSIGKPSMFLKIVSSRVNDFRNFIKELEKNGSRIIVTIDEDLFSKIDSEVQQYLKEKHSIISDFELPDPLLVFEKQFESRISSRERAFYSNQLLKDFLKTVTLDLKHPQKISNFIEFDLEAIEIDLNWDPSDNEPSKEEINRIRALISKKLREANSSDSEVTDFLTHLEEEDLLVSFHLSLFDDIPEDIFWRLHRGLLPQISSDDARLKRSRLKEKYLFLEDKPKNNLLKSIRAKRQPRKENGRSIQTLRFRDGKYSTKIQEYFRDNFADYLEKVFDHSLALISTDSFYSEFKPYLAKLLGFLSSINWLKFEGAIFEWASSIDAEITGSKIKTEQRDLAFNSLLEAQEIGKMAVNVRNLINSIKNEENIGLASLYLRYQLNDIQNMEVDSVYEKLDQLYELTHLFDENNLGIYISQVSISERSQAYDNFAQKQAGITKFLIRNNRQKAQEIYDLYWDKVKQAGSRWLIQIKGYDEFSDLLVNLALRNLPDVLDLICDWVSNPIGTNKLYGSMMWLSFFQDYLDAADNLEGPQDFLVLMSEDEYILDVVGEIMSSSLINLYPIWDFDRRYSHWICNMIKHWCQEASLEELESWSLLVANIQKYLTRDRVVESYFNGFLKTLRVPS